MAKTVEFKIQTRKSKTDSDINKMAKRIIDELSLYPMLPIYTPRVYITLKDEAGEVNLQKQLEIIKKDDKYYKKVSNREGFAPLGKFSGLANIDDVRVLMAGVIDLFKTEIEQYKLTSLTLYFNLDEKDTSWMAGSDAERIEAIFYGKNWKPNIEDAIVNSIVSVSGNGVYIDKDMISYLFDKEIITEKFIESLPIRISKED